MFVGCAGSRSAGLSPTAAYKVWQEFSSPGPQHHNFDPLIGDWSVEITYWPGNGKPPRTSHGVASYQWTLGNRFVRQDLDGVIEEMRYLATEYLGFDRVEESYANVWMDNFSTGVVTSSGLYDLDSNAFIMTGRYKDIVTREMKSFRSVLTVAGRDTHTYEMYEATPDGVETQTLRLVYIRK